MFYSQGRKTDMRRRMPYVSDDSLATSVWISADRNLHCLASLLVQQKFLGERKKRKAARPCHYIPNYKSELCKILVLQSKLIWLQVSLQRCYQRFGKRSTVMPSHRLHHWQLQGALATAVPQVFPLRRPDTILFTPTDTYRLPIARADNQPSLFLETTSTAVPLSH